jgi:hypothetical protein
MLDWTVIAYVVADHPALPDDAERFDDVAIEEAESVFDAALAQNGRIGLALQLDLGVRRNGIIAFVPPGTAAAVEEPAIGPSSLASFIRNAVEKCPAKHYMLVLWGHGAGPLGFFADPDPPPSRRRPGTITLPALTTVLKKSGLKLDILLAKSCYFATAEAAWQLADVADWMICSQARVPQRNWKIWNELFAQLGSNITDAALATLNTIDEHYSNPTERFRRKEIPFTLLRPREVKPLGDAITKLATQLGSDPEPVVGVCIERARPIRAGDKALLDLRTLCSGLRELPKYQPIADEIDEARATIVREHRPDDSMFGGLGIFHFPRRPELRLDSFADEVTHGNYATLPFCETTGWHKVALRQPT